LVGLTNAGSAIRECEVRAGPAASETRRVALKEAEHFVWIPGKIREPEALGVLKAYDG